MLDDVRRVVASSLFPPRTLAANRECHEYKHVGLDASAGLVGLIRLLSRELSAPLADTFYAIVIALTLEAAELQSGPFLLTDNCRDSSNCTIFGMVQREFGAIFEREPSEPFASNAARAARTMGAMPCSYRRLFAEYAYGEFPQLYINNYDGVQLNFLGVDGNDCEEVLGPSPIGDHLPWVNQYEKRLEAACGNAHADDDTKDAAFCFSSNLYCELEGDELCVCGRATSVEWFVTSVWPLIMQHAITDGTA